MRHNSHNRDRLPRIYVTCEDPECATRHELAARLGDPGHRRGDIVYLICAGCEGILSAELGAELTAAGRS